MGTDDESAELEALGIGGDLPEVGPRDGRTVFELWDGIELDEEGLLYVVDLGEGYAIEASENYWEAESAAEHHANHSKGTTELFITKYERVPSGLKIAILAHFEGRNRGKYSRKLDEQGIIGPKLYEGYDVSTALEPYTSNDTLSNDPTRPWEEKGVVWKWSMYEDLDYENWWPEQKESYRQERLYEARPKEPLFMDPEAIELLRSLGEEPPYLQEGLRLYFRTTDPSYYEDEVMAKGLHIGGDWLAASVRPEDAPWDENWGDDSEASLVEIEVSSAKDYSHVVEVPWIPAEGGEGYRIGELSKVLEVDLDPKSGTIEGDDVGKKIREFRREVSLIAVRTGPGPDQAIVFFDPERNDTNLRVVNISRPSED